VGVGVWVMGHGAGAQTPNPQSPIPNPQSPSYFYVIQKKFINYFIIFKLNIKK